MENVNTTVAAAPNTAPAAEPVKKVFSIIPETFELRTLDAADPNNQFFVDGLQKIYAMRNEDGTRRCDIIDLANGDRIICAPGSVGPIGDDETRRARADMVGQFAVLKNPVTSEDVKNDPARFMALTAATTDLTEVIGPALVVGPDDGTDTFTAATSDSEYLSGIVAWHGNPGRRAVRDMLAAILGVRGSNDSRDDLTDDQLTECGCPDCQEELASRRGRTLH